MAHELSKVYGKWTSPCSSSIIADLSIASADRYKDNRLSITVPIHHQFNCFAYTNVVNNEYNLKPPALC